MLLLLLTAERPSHRNDERKNCRGVFVRCMTVTGTTMAYISGLMHRVALMMKFESSLKVMHIEQKVAI
jgi:hypothetical protein